MLHSLKVEYYRLYLINCLRKNNNIALSASCVCCILHTCSLQRPFDVIAISETWLESDDCTDMMIEGYEVRNVIRKNNKSGGVAIYIHKSVNFKSMKCMPMRIDNIMECVSIELCINRGKNIIVICVYRTCGSSIAAFSEHQYDALCRYNVLSWFVSTH